jgi:hypothetical protein
VFQIDPSGNGFKNDRGCTCDGSDGGAGAGSAGAGFDGFDFFWLNLGRLQARSV